MLCRLSLRSLGFAGASRQFVNLSGKPGFVMASVDIGKKNAAYKAVDDWLKDGQTVGIGSGTTVVYVVDRIMELVKKSGLSITCIPTSFQALQLIKKARLPLSSMDDYPLLDVAFDGVDEITPEFASIKGGGGCLIQEKIVDANSKYFIVVADESKSSNYLGEHWKRGLPIEVIPMAVTPVKMEIERRFGGEANLRMAVAKMGPLLTDNGNFILDWKFVPSPSLDWNQVDIDLHMIPGVVGTGLFLGTAHQAYLGKADGTVRVVKNPSH
uniref:ribose-5-phosphate isomerase n=1 Tax=Mesocestoides corti TaxID=53468 RepID=A0A5K3FKS3_MESCO